MSPEPQAGVVEVAGEHHDRKVMGSIAERQQGEFQRRQGAVDVEDEKREPDEAREGSSGEAQGTHAKNQSMISAFRDFFLAAFSDSYSYQDHYGCCGTDTTYCSVPPRSGKQVSPEQDCLRTQNSSRSYHDLEPSASHDSSRRRRKKPLAIAVGFNYANDMNGRPVVITRGTSSSAASPGGSALSRRPIPGDLHKMSGRSTRFPPSGSTGSSSGSRPKNSSVSARSTGTSATAPTQTRQHETNGYAV